MTIKYKQLMHVSVSVGRVFVSVRNCPLVAKLGATKPALCHFKRCANWRTGFLFNSPNLFEACQAYSTCFIMISKLLVACTSGMLLVALF